MDFNSLLKKVFAGAVLTGSEARAAMTAMMSGDLDPAQVGGFLGAIQARGIDVEELTGLAIGMRSQATRVELADVEAIDTAGTGGDALSTFNFSTAAAFIAAGAGAFVAKHGNVSSSSRCGSADLLCELGVPLEQDADSVARSIREHRFGFMFAPSYHPATRHVMPVRRALQARTVFNLLGPLTNPAGVKRQVVGIYSEDLVDIYAGVLERLGCQRAMVVHGYDGMDELTLTDATRVCFVEEGRGLWVESLYPEDVGLPRASLSALLGGEPRENAAILRRVLEGRPGAYLDGSLYNAAAALWVAGAVDSLADGVALAREAVANGRAAAVLDAVTAPGVGSGAGGGADAGDRA